MRMAQLLLLTCLLAAFGASTALAQTPTERGYDETLGVIGEVENPQPREQPTSAPQPTEQPVQSAPSQDEQPAPAPAPAPVPQQQQVRQESGDLPFTGLDLGIVAVMGLVLLGTGFALRRTTRRSGA